jgi:putative hydrolase of the HAD superfamily
LTAPFEALVFDLGGVIVAHDNAFLGARLASRCPPGTTAEEVARIAQRDAFGLGTASIAQLHQSLAEEAGYAGDFEVFLDDWSCHLEVDPSMLGFVERLAKRNRVILFSNTNAAHWDFLAGASEGRLAAFKAYLSHEIGHLKPSVDSYLHVAATAGIDPARSIFFDDRAENVEGAREAGFQAEVFTGEADLRRLLTARGVDLG